MVKIKERKSELWKPAVVQNTGFISKNKKRKEQRLSKSLIASQSNSGETPSKKPVLDSSENSKIKANLGLKLMLEGNKESSFLSTSLPVKVDKKSKKGDVNKSFSSFSPVKNGNLRKFSGILKNTLPNMKSTPKKMNVNAGKFTEENKKPVNKKVSELKEKNHKPKFIDESDEEYSSDGDSGVNPGDFLDMEAEEGEETNEEDSAVESDDDTVSSDLLQDDDVNDDSEDDSGGSENDNDDSDDDNDNSGGDSDESDDDSNESDKSDEGKDTKEKTKEQPKVLQPKKVVKNEYKINESIKETKLEDKKTVAEKKKNQQVLQSKKVNGIKTEPLKSKNEIESEKDVEPTSKYVGFIRGIDSNISKQQVKKALGVKLNSSKIINVTVKKCKNRKRKNNYFIYVADEESLESLLNHTYEIGGTSFVVYKARESVKDKPAEQTPIAFMPRIPLTITEEILKAALEKELGAGSVLKIVDKRVNEKGQNRNVLVHFSDIEVLKKIVEKGECSINDTTVIVREAFEAKIKIPAYRVVYSLIPSKTPIQVLKKAVQSKIGEKSVKNIRFSLHKDSFAFVVFENEECQKKALESGNEVVVGNVKLKAQEFLSSYRKKLRADWKSKAETFKKRKLNDDKDANITSPQKNKPNAKKFKKQKMNDDEKDANITSPQKNKLNVTNNTSGNLKKSNKSAKVDKNAKKSGNASEKNNEKGNSPTSKGKENIQKKKNKVAKHFQSEAPKTQVINKKAALSDKIDAKKKNLKAKKNKKN